MSLILDVDAEAWTAHLRRYAEARPGLVPVIKGNGYGFGRRRLAAAAGGFGAGMVAVSEPEEVADVRAAFDGDILVMSPWLAHLGAPAIDDPRVVRTIGHRDAVAAARGRWILEGLTSMRRHGLPPEHFDQVAPSLQAAPPLGLALHLPLDRPDDAGPVAEVDSWIGRFADAGVALDVVWVSHLRTSELADLAARHPGMTFRPRVGTELWLGAAASFRARATVLDVRPLEPGDRFGYRQQKVRRPSVLLVVSGGTAAGIGLEAPVTPRGLVRRGKRLASGALESFGRSLSPFSVDGRRRWFAEPPHMQVSMLLLPAGVDAPEVGDEIPLDLRMTTTTFDVVRGLDG